MTDLWLGRRVFLLGSASTLVTACFRSEAKSSQTSGSLINTQIAELEAQLGGRIGVAALDTSNQARVQYRADERFAMCSTFKWVLAAAVLAQVDQNKLALEQRVSYGPDDLLDHAPVTRAHVSEGSLSVAALCAAAVEMSDNTAANLLLKRVGGPAGFTRFGRQSGDSITRLDRTEPSLNTNIPGDARDTTSPAAMVGLANRILVDATSPAVLFQASRNELITWMKNCRTGLSRLRAGLPADWSAGDKTGTGLNGAANDVAIIWPLDGKPLLLAVYMSGSTGASTALDGAHAEIARWVTSDFLQRRGV